MASVAGQAQVQAQNPMQGIQTMPANSSWIAAFEYDPANLTLTTHLKNGAIYQHKFVVPGEFTALQTAQNHSEHWFNNIKGKKASVKVKVQKSPNSAIKLGGNNHARY